MVVALVYNVEDVVHICGYEYEDFKTTFIGKNIMYALEGGRYDNQVIGEGYLSHLWRYIRMIIPYVSPH